MNPYEEVFMKMLVVVTVSFLLGVLATPNLSFNIWFVVAQVIGAFIGGFYLGCFMSRPKNKRKRKK